jgi:hypothetical protein
MPTQNQQKELPNEEKTALPFRPFYSFTSGLYALQDFSLQKHFKPGRSRSCRQEEICFVFYIEVHTDKSGDFKAEFLLMQRTTV